MGALLFPSLLLVSVLCCAAALLLALRAEWLRGMGRRPMFTLPRATYPTARGAAGPARVSSASHGPSHKPGASRRVVERSNGPRGAVPAKAWPFSSLINTPAAGAARSFSSGS